MAIAMGGLPVTWLPTHAREKKETGRRREESTSPLTCGPHELGKVKREKRKGDLLEHSSLIY